MCLDLHPNMVAKLDERSLRRWGLQPKGRVDPVETKVDPIQALFGCCHTAIILWGRPDNIQCGEIENLHRGHSESCYAMQSVPRRDNSRQNARLPAGCSVCGMLLLR
jgi:hypothetical protein